MLKTKLNTGSPMPKKPVSKKTSGPAGGKSPAYNPKGAVKFLDSQCHSAPSNGGPMKSY